MKITKILFFHVPKTAGTSFRSAIEKKIPKENIFYDYGLQSKLTRPVIKQWLRQEIDIKTLEKKLHRRNIVIYGGHIRYKKYTNDILKPYKRITFIREPFQRAYSEYNHRKERGDFNITFETFIEMPEYQNTLLRTFENADNLKKFDFIGFTEFYRESIELFNKKFGYDLEIIETNVRRGSLKETHQSDIKIKKRFMELNREDINLYDSLLIEFKKNFSPKIEKNTLLKVISPKVICKKTQYFEKNDNTYLTLSNAFYRKDMPLFILNGYENWIEEFNNQKIPGIDIYNFHNLFVFGQGILCDSDYNLISSDELHSTFPLLLKGACNKDLIKKNEEEKLSFFLQKELIIKRVEEPCIPLSRPGERVYGHWLVDILPRVAMAKLLGVKAKFAITTLTPKYALEFLSMMGINENELIRYDPLKEGLLIEHAIVPTYIRKHWRFSPLMNTLRNFFSFNHLNTITNDKIYISRGNYNNVQTLINAKEITEYLQKKDFHVIEPHTLSIPEQIFIFSKAKIVIGEYGSALHNSIFCDKGTHIVILQGDAIHSYIQVGLGACLNQPTGIVFGKSTRDNPREFFIPLEQIEAALNYISN